MRDIFEGMRKKRGTCGFSLIELMVVVSLGAVLVGVGLYSLRSGSSKTSSIALAAALADEFRAARQMAISRGYPVAVGVPTGGRTRASSSIYRLEGWNVPRVTDTTGYSGDYPRLGFAAARWSGGDFDESASIPPLSKFGGFMLANWIPSDLEEDAILCFTPDGGMVTNGLSSINGRTTVVVAMDPVVLNGVITGGSEPSVVYVSVTGAVEHSKWLPGSSLATGQDRPRAAGRSPEKLAGSARIRLSKIAVRPAALAAPVDAFCTPGEQVTFEMWAYDPKGRQLFTQWKQDGPEGRRGNFGFPSSSEGPLRKETERMEYVESPPSDIDWNGADPPPGGCFRARWSWTVPQDSRAGDLYSVTADVQDATGEATIENRPDPIEFKTSPEGRFVAEVRNVALGRWELVRMNRNGTGRVVLTPPGVEETMPSVDRSATKLALLQGPIGNVNQRRVKVRSLAGGGEVTIAGPGRYTSVSLSPDGGWISYRLDDAATAGEGRLFIRKLDEGAPVFSRRQYWRPIPIPAEDIEPERTGWSPDGKYVLWSNGGDGTPPGGTGNPAGGGIIEIGNLTTSGHLDNVRTLYTNNFEEGMLYSPTVFHPSAGQARLLFTSSTLNPVVVHTEFRPNESNYGNAVGLTPSTLNSRKIDLNGRGEGAGSGDFDDNLACISPNGRMVVLPRIDRPAGDERYAIIARWNEGAMNFTATASDAHTIRQPIRSIVWIP